MAYPQAEDRDNQKLAELGYKQERSRAWSGFSSLAISFTIISALAGSFTVYGQAWNNGGPIAISSAWPIICGLVLVTINDSGFGHGTFWWCVLPVGFPLTMYAQTSYDAPAHVAEETHEAEIKVARGLWQSLFHAGLFGWFALLAITFKGPVRTFELDEGMGIPEAGPTAPEPAT